jgi:N-glycosylase/DNA lyase
MSYSATIPIVTSKLHEINLEGLRSYRKKNKASVIKRINEFKSIGRQTPDRIFYELCFCILTPQANGQTCDKVVVELVNKGVLVDPNFRRSELEESLKKTRFWRKKTKYLIRAWERFVANGNNGIVEDLIAPIGAENSKELRDRVRNEMKGMGIGMKEASHFLRNIGYGDDLAILDRHIINCLYELNVICDKEKKLKSEGDYHRLEERMMSFSSSSGMPIEELDLLFWSAKTGYIFK